MRDLIEGLSFDDGYFTVVVPPAAYGAGGTKWHSETKTLTRGAFLTKKEAKAWAKKHLQGAKFSIKRIAGISGIEESVSRECFFYKAKNGKWYMELEDEYDRDMTTYGPFSSFRAAEKYLERNFSNPGAYSDDDSGTMPVPRNAVKPRARVRW